jgi:hypothetical protein
MPYKINPITGKHDYYQLPATTPSEVVNFDQVTPTTPGVIFDPNTPDTVDVLYVSSIDASTWIYNGTSYVTYTIVTPSSTPFYLSGTTIDAGGNKTAAIHHVGPLRATTFQGNGVSIVGLNATNLAIGTVNVARLGTGATGAGLKFLSDNNTWQTIITGGKVGIPNQTTGIFTYYTTLELARDAASSGDTIFVYPGAYTVTTTDTNGLAKSGVNWFFYPGTVVTKTTNGWMFSLSGLANACNVYGQGKFYKTGGTLGIHWGGDGTTQPAFDFIFEAEYVQQTVNSVAFTVQHATTYISTFNIKRGINTGNHLFYFNWQANTVINAVDLKSTAGSVIATYNGGLFLTVNAINVTSTTTTAISGLYNINPCVFNINYCTGSTYGYSTNGGGVDVVVNGYTNGIVMASGGTFVHNGSCYYLLVTSGNFIGGNVEYSTINGGTVSYKAGGSVNANHTIAGGIANIELPYHGYSFYLNATGGKTILHGNGYNVFTIGARIIAGGTVILNGDLEYGGTDYLGNRDVFTLNSGKLVINGRIKNLLTAQATGTCVTYNGGTLIVNAGVLLTSNVEVPPIIVGGANRDIKVLAGG